MDTTIKLIGLLNKASRLTDSQAKEAAALMLEFFEETRDTARIADYLMRFK